MARFVFRMHVIVIHMNIFAFFLIRMSDLLKMYSYYMDILTKNILDNVIHRFKTSWIINRTFYKTYMYHGVCVWFILSKLKTV